MRLIAMLVLLAGVVAPAPPYRILVARARVASIAVPRQPTGIAILRTP